MSEKQKPLHEESVFGLLRRTAGFITGILFAPFRVPDDPKQSGKK